MPKDFLDYARTVICYFLPFHRSVINSNIPGKYSSHEWAKAFTETNKLILNLNKHIKKQLEQQGHKAAIVPAAYNYDEDKLICQWSHRHVGYIAGLGKFGLNNMLITEKGCCGRIGTVITNLKMTPSPRPQLDYCLYKKKGTCKKCVQRCVSGALKVESYDRHKCYRMLLANDKKHSELELTDACGKCCVGLPCSLTKPV
jgi:epoxyqueuosine reductase QueG